MSAALKIFAAARSMLYASAFLFVWAWLALSARRFDDRLPFSLAEWGQPFGWLLASLGTALAALCVATFVTRGEGTPAPFDPPRRFVATGPYRHIRNPMYLGAFGMLLGFSFVLRSPAMIGFAIAFLLLAHAFVIFYEEPGLARRFGASYDEYRASMHRWVPRLHSSRTSPGCVRPRDLRPDRSPPRSSSR